MHLTLGLAGDVYGGIAKVKGFKPFHKFKTAKAVKGALEKGTNSEGTLIIADDDWVPVPENKSGFRRTFRM